MQWSVAKSGSWSVCQVWRMHVCRWAGAMRGAVSVALVYLYYDPDGTTVDQMKSSLISMTLTVVLFSTIVYGAITKPMLDLLLGAKCARTYTPLVDNWWK